MKKLITILLIISFPLFADIGKKFKLGSTVQSVKKTYGKPEQVMNRLFYYSVNFAGKKAKKVFYHHKGKIYMTVIMFNLSSSRGESVKRYLEIKKLLDMKYGKFTISNVWTDDTFKNNSEYFYTALQAGHVTIQQTKEIDGVEIQHKLYCNKYTYYHLIMYFDIKLNNDYNDYATNKNASDL